MPPGYAAPLHRTGLCWRPSNRLHTELVDIELAVRGPYEVHAWRWSLDADPEGQSLELTRDFTEVSKWVAAISETSVVADPAAA